MVMLNGAFDATQHQPLDRSIMPAGEYTATITKTEAKENRNGQGSHLNVEFTISEGPHKGRKVWQNLNCWHPNQQASQIAWAELSAIAHAVQVLNFQDTTALHNIPLIIQVVINQQGNNEYKACKPITPTGHQPSPGRAFAQNNPPLGAPTHAPTAHNPNINQNINPDGTPKTPQQMAQTPPPQHY